MKTAAVLTALAVAACVAVGAAFADGLPVPTVPTVPAVPSVPIPPVTVPVAIPSVSLPKLPIATPKTSTHVSTPTAISRSVPSISITSGGVSVATSSSGVTAATGASGGANGGSGSSSGASASSGAAPAGPPIARLRSSRPWLAQHGPANHRRTILNFRLPAASRVVFSVTQVSPVCRAAGHFAVTGKQGLNRVVFRGRVNGRDLAPGTYKITARVPGKGTVLRVIVVVVDAGVPSPSDLTLARKSDVCSAAARGLASSSARVAAANGSGTRGAAAATSSGDARGAAAGSGGASSGPTSGTAGETFTAQSAAPFSPERVSENVRNPLVILALGAAILLLGLAALPRTAIPDPRLTDVLVRHRVEVALAGAAALAAALIALALA